MTVNVADIQGSSRGDACRGRKATPPRRMAVNTEDVVAGEASALVTRSVIRPSCSTEGAHRQPSHWRAAGGTTGAAGASAPDAGVSSDSGAAAGGGQTTTDGGHATDGAITCQRDDDCAGGQICDHDVATCTTPPPTCGQLTTEAACAARADCTPFYGGMTCTNDVGSACHSGEANCTCATYSFAACVARD